MRWVILAILILAAVWVIWTYNLLVSLRHRIQNGWKQIDVQLKRRHDLIPNLVEAVRGYMKYEQETLEKVMQARSRAVSSTGVKETAQAENLLTQSLGRIFALMENYPDLKANENVLKLQEELTTTENQISFARQYYNDLVMRYNMQQEVFPSSLVAKFFNFGPSEFFSVPEAERATPRVNLSLQA
ncbi:MAG TPA: LemA family protein [Candidatus Binatia bacterium]|nr:LemA family protein [Candidatus Binatia bacterium]